MYNKKSINQISVGSVIRYNDIEYIVESYNQVEKVVIIVYGRVRISLPFKTKVLCQTLR